MTASTIAIGVLYNNTASTPLRKVHVGELEVIGAWGVPEQLDSFSVAQAEIRWPAGCVGPKNLVKAILKNLPSGVSAMQGARR